MTVILKPVLKFVGKQVVKDSAVKTFKKFIKYIACFILAVVIVFSNTWSDISSTRIQKAVNYGEALKFENMGKEREVVYSVERVSFGCPVGRKVSINARFAGQTVGYWNGSSDWHNGIDLNLVNEKVYSAISGRVVSNGWDYFGGGNLLIIEGIDGWRVWYAHMGKIDVVVGQNIMIGDYVGVSGNTGSASTGHHLHVSILKYGEFVDPMKYIVNCTL